MSNGQQAVFNIANLHAAIAANCPIHGVSVGSVYDKSTWQIAFADDATDEQKASAATVLEAFDLRAVTLDDVRAEAQRRIVLLVGATDLTGCLIKQLNANMRANELNDYRHERELTEQEQVEAAMLRGLADKIKAIRASSDAFTDPIPADFRDDKFWPIGT